MKTNTHSFKVGDKVTTSNYPGIIVRTSDSAGSAWMGNMVEVRLSSGVCCVSASDCKAVRS